MSGNRMALSTELSHDFRNRTGSHITVAIHANDPLSSMPDLEQLTQFENGLNFDITRVFARHSQQKSLLQTMALRKEELPLFSGDVFQLDQGQRRFDQNSNSSSVFFVGRRHMESLPTIPLSLVQQANFTVFPTLVS